MNAKTSKPRNIGEILALVKAIFDCNYEAKLFVKKNLKTIDNFSLKALYPITFLLKNKDPMEEKFNSPKNLPILYFPAAKKISVVVEAEEHRFTMTSYVGLKTKLVFNRQPLDLIAEKKKIPALIGGELLIDCDYEAAATPKNTLLNVFTIFELLLAIKDKALQARLIAALTPALQEKFDIFVNQKREKITFLAKMKKRIYKEHFDFFEGTTKIKNFYQYKTLFSASKRKAAILFDGYCTDKEINLALKRTLADLFVFYRIFFTDIILN
jgi:hypothetical protein